MESSMWECDCGDVEYGELPPQECSKCWKMNSFVEVPEDKIEEKKENVLGDIKKNLEEEDGDED